MKKYLWLMALLGGATLAAEETATVNRDRVNVRGGPSLSSEVIGQLRKGNAVTFFEEIAVEKPKAGEPARWAQIKIPANTPVWVFSDFLDGNKVKVKKLNLRAGPGENYSVVGTLAKDDTIKEIRQSEGWTEIETPESARAYVDAAYLDRAEGAKVAAADPLKEPPKVYEPPAKPTENPVASKPEPAAVEAPKVEKQPEAPKVVKSNPAEVKAEPAEAKKEEPKVEAPKDQARPAVTPAKPEENTAQPVAATPTPTPPPVTAEKPAEVTRVLPEVAPPVVRGTNIVMMKRVVRREGTVRATKLDIQAPTYFELRAANGKVINYLTANKSGIKLKDYKGLRVIATGEEGIEPRFPDRPILDVETIEVAP